MACGCGGKSNTTAKTETWKVDRQVFKGTSSESNARKFAARTGGMAQKVS